MRSVTFVTCGCGAHFSPIALNIPSVDDGIATELEGVCPVCLTEIQVGLAAKPVTVPTDLSDLEG